MQSRQVPDDAISLSYADLLDIAIEYVDEWLAEHDWYRNELRDGYSDRYEFASNTLQRLTEIRSMLERDRHDSSDAVCIDSEMFPSDAWRLAFDAIERWREQRESSGMPMSHEYESAREALLDWMTLAASPPSVTPLPCGGVSLRWKHIERKIMLSEQAATLSSGERKAMSRSRLGATE